MKRSSQRQGVCASLDDGQLRAPLIVSRVAGFGVRIAGFWAVRYSKAHAYVAILFFEGSGGSDDIVTAGG